MGYDKSDLNSWIKNSERQYFKDFLFINRIKKFFKKGSVLELGSGCGQLSAFLTRSGFNVTASDINDFFIEYMNSQNIKSVKVDALDITGYTNIKYDNILSQGLSTLVTKELPVIEKTYKSIYEALNNNGRAIIILPNGYNVFKWSSLKVHKKIIRKMNFKIVKIFRDQVFPSIFYTKINQVIINIFEITLGKFLGIRNIVIVEK